MVEKESSWLLPKNFKKMEDREKADAQKGILNEGLFTAYYLCRKNNDFNYAKSYCLSDDRAASYIRNLGCFFEQINLKLQGKVLDVGCSVGTITNAIDNVNIGGQTSGLDFSEDAIAYAQKQYPNVKWYCQSADNLNNFEDSSIDFIHAREFYPLDRTNDHEYHLQYLKTFHTKLKSGGVLILNLRNLKKCFSNTYKKLTNDLADLDYQPVVRKQVVRHAFFKVFGEQAYKWKLLNVILTVITTVYSRLTKMKASYFYIYIKN